MYSSRLDLQLCTLEYTLEYLLHHCHENMMNACELLLMRARARRAYCKKCRVHIGSKRSGWSNIPDLRQYIQDSPQQVVIFKNKYNTSYHMTHVHSLVVGYFQKYALRTTHTIW